MEKGQYRLSQTGEQVQSLLNKIPVNEQAITEEVNNRQTAVSEEAQARSSADQTLQENIEAEARARQNAISAEQERAEQAEALLQPKSDNALLTVVKTIVGAINELWNKFADYLEGTKRITYANLVALRNTGTLKPGQKYRITDFVTTVGIAEDGKTGMVMVRSAGHPFDIIVRADSASVLSETAWATQHDGDQYFANTKMEAWQLKYCLDNDTNRFEWADTVNGKGVVYELTDEFGNTLPYDFKNIQYRRFPVMGQSHLYVNSGYPTEMDDDGYVTDVIGARQTFNIANPTDQQRLNALGKYLHPFVGYYSEQYIYDDGYTDSWDGLELEDGGTRMFAMVTDNYESYGILAEVDTTKGVWCHVLGVLTAFTAGETTDRSMTGKVMDFQVSPHVAGDKKTGLHYSIHVNNNAGITIKNSRVTGYFYGDTLSGDIWYATISGNIYYTTISGSIRYSVLSGYIWYATISGYINSATISGSIRYSVLSGNIDRVTISGYIESATISGNIYYTTISGYIESATISGYIWYATISGYIESATISGYTNCATISGDIWYATISGSLNYVDFKAYAYYLSFPSLSHCMVVSNLPEGGGWDDLMEVSFTAQDYEQVITRNANDEIVVLPLYAI